MKPGDADRLAERIAAGLRLRKAIGDERRLQEREDALRNSEKALARYHAARVSRKAS